jgi:hypothetical protein
MVVMRPSPSALAAPAGDLGDPAEVIVALAELLDSLTWTPPSDGREMAGYGLQSTTRSAQYAAGDAARTG